MAQSKHMSRHSNVTRLKLSQVYWNYTNMCRSHAAREYNIFCGMCGHLCRSQILEQICEQLLALLAAGFFQGMIALDARSIHHTCDYLNTLLTCHDLSDGETERQGAVSLETQRSFSVIKLRVQIINSLVQALLQYLTPVLLYHLRCLTFPF